MNGDGAQVILKVMAFWLQIQIASGMQIKPVGQSVLRD
jgi:hypothetical protein